MNSLTQRWWRAAFAGLALFLPVFGPLAWSAEEKPKATVFVNPVHAQELFETLTYPARVVPQINTQLLSESDGVVTGILSPLGQRVKKGQRLIKVSHTDPIYQYAPLFITAPVGGIVSSVEVTEGTQVVKGQKLVSVTDPSLIRLKVEVPALDLPYLAQGMKGEFRTLGNSTAVPVEIRGISPFVDPATGTASAELMPSSQLPPGVTGQVNFKANLHRGFAIPEHAILYKGQETYVNLLEKDKAKRVLVSLGKRQRGIVEILKGLTENASLIERSSRYLSDGESVAIQSADGEKK